MKNIINLVRLEYNTILSLKKVFLIIIGVSAIIGVTEPEMISFIGAMFLMVSSYTVISYEERSKMNYLICSLPITRKEYITSRYVFGILNTIIAILLSTVLYYVVFYMDKMGDHSLSIGSLITTIALIGLFVVSILVPFTLIIGAEKGRYVLVFMAIIPICFSDNIGKVISNFSFDITKNILITICILGAITVILTSFFITSNVYEKKAI